MVEAMEIEKGFRKTEVGVIPNDWEVKKLGDCLLKNPDYGINAPAVPYDEVLPVYLRITDITEDGRYSKKSIVSVNNIFSSSFVLEKGDLVFARTGASVGKTYLYNQEDGKLVFAGFLIRVKPNPNQLLPEYLKFYTQTHYYWNWIKANSMRTGQPGVNGNEYKELLVPLPPTKAEQTAIATALNDADALITRLEKFIAKKRNIKHGAMEQLLTSKKRLPGFSGEWKVKLLGNITTKIGDGIHSTPQYVNSSDFFFINGNNLIDNSIKIFENTMCVSKDEYNKHKIKLNERTILLSINGTIGNIAFFNDEKVILGKSAAYINVDDFTDKKYIFYSLQSSRIKNYFEYELTGSTIRNLSLKSIRNTPILIPASKEEQQAIAQLLSDMDAEIVALEKKLEKYKMIKQGMMQNLLMGIIRLV